MTLPNRGCLWYNVPMKQTDLEPGFLQAYRLFVVTRIVFWIVIGPILVVLQMASEASLATAGVTGTSLVEKLTLPNIIPILVVELLLLVLLILPQAPRRLGRWFVPLTLLIGLAPLLVGYYWWPSENPLQTPFVIFFFVMLVLIAWQYPFPYVLVYVVGLSLYEASLSTAGTNVPWTVNLGWLILQAATMSIVGYVIVALVSVQREQREALAKAYEQQAAANVRLQQYAAAVEELSISRERNRLARELHDTLAHSLSAVTVQLEAIRSLWQVNPTAARGMLDRADETARKGLTEARRALQALRASPLQALGLALALQDLAETAAERSGASLELRAPRPISASLSPAVEQGVYRIAQEALENVVRHAEARSLVVCLEEHDGVLSLSIEDDGLGVPAPAGPASEANGQGHLGIRGMQERASVIGGQLQIASQAGQGTKIYLTVPI
jgi:signal transduction histidine kinase